MITIREAIIQASKKLAKKKIKTANLDTEILLAFVLKKTKEFLYTHPRKLLTSRQAQRLKILIQRRAKGEPIAYLTKHKELYGLDFYVDKRVLVPRPETELLIDQIIDYVKNKEFTIADIGTGSGCIAITLKKYLPQTKIYAIDISSTALSVAEKNAGSHQVKINFLQGDLVQPVKHKKIDIIVANLPYVPANYPSHPALKFEPKIALAGGDGGLDIIKALLQQIKNLKHKPELIITEFGYDQATQLKKYCRRDLPDYKIQIGKDLGGLDRILILEKGPATK